MKRVFCVVLVVAIVFGCGSSSKHDPKVGEQKAFVAQLQKLETELEADSRWNNIFFDVDFCPEWGVNGKPDGIRLVVLRVCVPQVYKKQTLKKFAKKLCGQAKKMLQEKGVDLKTVRGFLVLFEDTNGLQQKFSFPDSGKKKTKV